VERKAMKIGLGTDPGPAEMDERIVAAFGDAARSDEVGRLVAEVTDAANAADAVAKAAREKALDPRLSRDAASVARREMNDAEFDRDRLTEAGKLLGERRVELKAAEDSAALRAEHEALASKRERLLGELVGMTDLLAQIGKLAMQIDACEREIKRWNPLGGRTHGYVRPVLSADLPPTLAGLFADARVMDSFIGMAMSPPLPSSPSAKLRAV
jgi:hypothetical protein